MNGQSIQYLHSGATGWLHQSLIAGAVASAHIKALAEQAGIGAKSLRNARERLGVVTTRHGNGRTMRSVWALPLVDDEASKREEIQHAKTEVQGIRAQAGTNAEMSIFVSLGGRRSSTATSGPAGHGAVGGHVQVMKLLTAEQSSRASILTPQEIAWVEFSAGKFMTRGMTEIDGFELAIRLVVERNRNGGKGGSCLECQCFDHGTCAPGAGGHTPGPRDPSVIWMCWCSRRI